MTRGLRSSVIKRLYLECIWFVTLFFMNPHQGDHAWAAVFDEGDDDARIYLHAPGRPWALVARSAAFFFWDLAQTGIGWFNENEYEGGKPTRRTDIGVVLE